MNHEPQTDSFLGYRRARGRPGIRNYLLVLNITGLTNPAARRVAAGLHGARMMTMPFGASADPRGEEVAIRTLAGMALHPNAGAVLVLSTDRARTARLTEAIGDPGRPRRIVELGDHGRDVLTFSTHAVREGAHLMRQMSRTRRERFHWRELCVAVECGLSDPTSGLAANPLIGDLVDRLVSSGGSAVFGETTEWLGSEQRLAERAADPEVTRRIVEAVERRERIAADNGIDLTGNNPNKANIDAGLTTIEDKAIGSTAKSGTAPISGLLDYAEPAGRGLFAMDGASYTPESLTGLVAAGAQICLFATGLGNSYVSAMAPTIKMTGNRRTGDALPEQIDFDASGLIDAPPRRNALCGELIGQLLDVASGTLTFGEILGEGDEVISRYGESL